MDNSKKVLNGTDKKHLLQNKIYLFFMLFILTVAQIVAWVAPWTKISGKNFEFGGLADKRIHYLSYLASPANILEKEYNANVSSTLYYIATFTIIAAIIVMIAYLVLSFSEKFSKKINGSIASILMIIAAISIEIYRLQLNSALNSLKLDELYSFSTTGVSIIVILLAAVALVLGICNTRQVNTNLSESTNEELENKSGSSVKKIKTVRSQFMLKKGAYTVAITALVLAALILVNWLVDTLGKRFHLEYDMTPDKTYSVNEENLNYIKNVDTKITVTVLSAEYNYVSSISQLAANYYHVYGDDDESYYDQTLELLEKYRNYNDNIKVVFLDSSTLEFSATLEKYKDDNLFYGDMIVTNDSNSRYKAVHFSDIYQYDDEYAYYQYVPIEGNNLETALTSAIAYCVSARTPKGVIFTGHSDEDYSPYYTELLKKYNYDFDIMGSQIITEISDEYDLAVIIAPAKDFTEGELDLFSSFLKNGGKLSKSLVYIASAASDLPNLEEFLAQWGIIDGGYVVLDAQTAETAYYQLGDMTVLASAPADDQNEDEFDDAILSGMGNCITSKNAPFEIGKPVSSTIKVNGVMKCSETTVIANMNESGELEYSDIGEKQCYTVIEARDYTYDEDNNLVTSYVYAFSSLDFIAGYAEYEGYSNKNITLACTDRAAHFTSEGLNFISKTIIRESFTTNDKEVSRVRVIFQWALPLIIVALSIFIYVKRRNA